MKDAAIDSGYLWARNKSSLHALQRFNHLYGWVFVCVGTFVVLISIQRMSFEPEASLFLEAEIAVAVGAKIHGSGAVEETTVVRTETVAFRRLRSILFRHRF
ncbi:hypothetical protein Bca52824_038704 [Brassica carinata]|uniref:Uncharacterized protein n=1 Tax=Brassica carinata TaxID=52824 RepID=A0A8X7UTX7_BRACI|nr:hypothetical protein Bca52824_038704 [Brassica carinata]